MNTIQYLPRIGPLYSIGATTVGSGRDWSPTFRLGEPTICCSPNLAVVFKKPEISQQVLFHNFHLIDYFDSNNKGRNHGRKVEILEVI